MNGPEMGTSPERSSPEGEKVADASGETSVSAVLEWWEGLDKTRGDRAELRRGDSLEEVAFCAAYHRLRAVWPPSRRRNEPQHSKQLAVVAHALAHVKHHVPGQALAHRAARGEEGAKAPVSALRFRRLLQVTEHQELGEAIRRILQLLDHKVDVVKLASDLYRWDEQVRRNWAMDYYDALPKSDKK